MIKTISLTFALIVLTALHTSARFNATALYDHYSKLDDKQLLEMGVGLDLRQSADSALVCYTVVADRLRHNPSSPQKQSWLAHALNNIGYIYGNFFCSYKQSMAYFDEALEIAVKYKLTRYIAYAHLNKGGIYSTLTRIYGKRLFLDEARNELSACVTSAIEVKDWKIALFSILNMGMLYFDNGDFVPIERAMSQIRVSAISTSLPLYKYVDAYYEGLSAFSKRNYQLALKSFETMASIDPKYPVLEDRLEFLPATALAETYSVTGDNPKAISITLDIIEKLQGNPKMADDLLQTYSMLARFYSLNRQTSQSTAWRDRYYREKDSILSENEVVGMKVAPITATLEEVKQNLEQEARKRRTMSAITLIVIAALLLVSGLTVVIAIKNKRLNTLVKSLYHKNKELISLKTSSMIDSDSNHSAVNNRLVNNTLIEIDSVPAVEDNDSHIKYRDSGLTPQEKKLISSRILEALSDPETIFDPSLSFKTIVERVGFPQKKVSQTINETMECNFRALVNKHRIDEACRRLMDLENYGKHTIEHIAESVGFNSMSNFNSTFKSRTGLTPKQFRKNAMMQE